MRFLSLALLVVLACTATPARAGTPAQGTWVGLALKAPYDAIVYDSDQNVLLGMSAAGQVLEYDLNTNVGWYEIVTAGTPPVARWGKAAIYDPTRKSMIIACGGNNDTYYNDLWELSLVGTPTWTQLPSAPFPSRTGYPNIAWDPTRQRILLTGGYDSHYVYHSDVWAIEPGQTPTWTQLAPDGQMPPRTLSTWAVDPAGDQAILFGGYMNGAMTNETWRFDLASNTWQQLVIPGPLPPARENAYALKDPFQDRVLIYGGNDGGPALGDLWQLTLSPTPGWSQITPGGVVPSGASGLYSAYDPYLESFKIVQGKSTVLNLELSNDVWLPPTTATSSGVPQRSYASMVLDAGRDRTLLFGGSTAEFFTRFNDVWVQSLFLPNVWTQLTTQGTPPSARSEHSAILDPVRNRMIVYSGNQLDGRLYQLALGASPTWSRIIPGGVNPPARRSHSAIYDPVGDRMVVFGGSNGTYDLNDVWALDLATDTWAQLTTTGTPPAGRQGHGCIYDPVRHRMVVFGGIGAGQRFDDTWALDLSTLAWSQIVPAGGVPPARDHGIAVYDRARDQLVVGYGNILNGQLADVWALPLAPGGTWTELTPGGVATPSVRAGAVAVYDATRDRLILSTGAYYPDLQTIATLGDSWALAWTSPTSTPPMDVATGTQRLSSFPNPSAAGVTLRFELPRAGRAQVAVFDLAGRRIAKLVQGSLTAGLHETTWDGLRGNGAPVPAGIYFAVLTTASGRTTRRIVRME